ncbi:MAG TPA: hypothetical protein VNL15_06645, partial [Dehalococcoidia bacterium]|nr:hypothetical protein [Dehalococcoidia bacterium]
GRSLHPVFLATNCDNILWRLLIIVKSSFVTWTPQAMGGLVSIWGQFMIRGEESEMVFALRFRLFLVLTIVLAAVGTIVVALIWNDGSTPRSSLAQGDVDQWEVTINRTNLVAGTSGKWTAKLWLSLDRTQGRIEVTNSDGQIETIETQSGSRLDGLHYVERRPSMYTSQTLKPSDPLPEAGPLQTITGAKRRLVNGHGTQVGTETIKGVQAIASEIEVTSGDEGAEWVRTRELIHPNTGFLLARIFLGDENGQLVETGRVEYTYKSLGKVESNSLPLDFFVLSPPNDVNVYLTKYLTFSDVTTFSDFELFVLKTTPPGFDLSSTVERQNKVPGPPPDSHDVRFIYESAGRDSRITVLNLNVSSVQGFSRCPTLPTSLPLEPTPPAGNVILDGNSRCGLGARIETPRGTAVYRPDNLSLEIQIGNTVVIIIGSSFDLLMDAIARLDSVRVINSP